MSTLFRVQMKIFFRMGSHCANQDGSESGKAASKLTVLVNYGLGRSGLSTSRIVYDKTDTIIEAVFRLIRRQMVGVIYKHSPI